MLMFSLTVFFLLTGFSVLLLLCITKLIENYIRSFRLENLCKRAVFITGCDSGFGHLLAVSLDKMGVPVFASCLTDEGVSQLREQCSSRLKPLKLNVTSEKDIDKAVQFVEDNLEHGEVLWGLVNNAGIMTMIAPAEFHQKADYEKSIAVNLLGPIMVTTKFLPLLRKSRGRVVNMASVVTMIPMPNLAAYTITKSAIEAFSDTLRREMYHIGVSVHTIHPTGFKTNIAPLSLMEYTVKVYNTFLSAEQKLFYKDMLDDLHMAAELKGHVLDSNISKVTDKITHALFSKFPEIKYLVGPGAKAVFWTMSLTPYWFSDFIFQGGPTFAKLCKRMFPNKV